MRKNFVLFVGAMALCGSATGAMAGAYGEAQEMEETTAASPAAAGQVVEEIDYAATGCYAGAGGSYVFEVFDRTGSRSDIANSGGFFVNAGYRLHPNIAVEARYDNFVEFDLDPGQYDGWALTANAKGYALTGRFQPYAAVGVGYIDMDAKNTPGRAGDSAVMRFGLGMDAYVTEHLSVGPEVSYVLPFGDASDFDMIALSLGVNYRF